MLRHCLQPDSLDALLAALDLLESAENQRLLAERLYWDQLERKVNKPRSRDIELYEDEFLSVTMTPEEFARLELV